jgi:hypothetical protein
MRVFAVWEPILFTDWSKPGAGVLARLSDPRAVQFWDSQHLVAKQLAKDARAPQPEPHCCTRNGILWDLAAVYPPHVLWTDRLPQAVLFDGPVVDRQPQIQTLLLNLRPPVAKKSRTRATLKSITFLSAKIGSSARVGWMPVDIENDKELIVLKSLSIAGGPHKSLADRPM